MAILRRPPTVKLVGEVDHSDFRDAIELLRGSAQIVREVELPELIVVAQSRPHTIGHNQLQQLQRTAPLAGFAALLGTWCEGETRTGRPWPVAARFYWYEFPAWWRRQLQLHAAGRCPDWLRPTTQLIRQCVPFQSQSRSRLIVLRTVRSDNADALADVLNQAGHSTVWQRHDRQRMQTRGAYTGIWDGGQLNETEAADLEAFCKQMSRDGAPVVVLLDFPRRDRVERAYEIGAGAVLGKPWINHDLLDVVEATAATSHLCKAA